MKVDREADYLIKKIFLKIQWIIIAHRDLPNLIKQLIKTHKMNKNLCKVKNNFFRT